MNPTSRNAALLVVIVILATGSYVAYTRSTMSTSTIDQGKDSSADSPQVRITDSSKLYSFEIPKNWAIVGQEGAMGVQLSQVTAESLDWQSEADTSAEGPFTPTYYKSGAFIQFHVSNTISSPPYHGASDGPSSGVITTKEITIDGEKAIYHIFKEPSTAEGLLLDAHLTHGGDSYTLRFAYNPTKYPQGEQIFAEILKSIRFQ